MKLFISVIIGVLLAFGSASPVDADLDNVVHAKATPSQSPTATSNSSTSSPPCFPHFAQVRIAQKQVPIHLVKEGDIVAVGNDRTSPVFLITHNDHDVIHEFVTLTTQHGAKLTATSGHYVPVGDNGAQVLVAAGEIKIGDYLTLENGTRSPVVHIGTICEKGLYSLQTAHGDIVIDGVVASTYTTAADARFSHAALLPLRASFAGFGITAKWNNYWADVVRNALGVHGEKIAL